MTFFLYNNRAFFDSHLKAGSCMGAHMHYRMFHTIILYYESSLNLGAIKNSIIALISRHLAYQVGRGWKNVYGIGDWAFIPRVF